jgi:hypothetical protein
MFKCKKSFFKVQKKVPRNCVDGRRGSEGKKFEIMLKKKFKNKIEKSLKKIIK